MSSRDDSVFARTRKTLDKYHSTIDTVGNVVGYLQNSKIIENQRNIAVGLAAQIHLLNEQNEQREKEYEKLESLIRKQEIESQLQKQRDEMKVILLSMAPKCKDVLATLQSDTSMKNETRALLLKHLLVSYKLMDENKSVVSDVNYYTFLHDFKKRISYLEQLNDEGIKSVENLKNHINVFSTEINEIIVIKSVEKADLKEVYESGLSKEIHKLKNLINNLKMSHENGKFTRFIPHISSYIDILNEVVIHAPEFNYESHNLPFDIEMALSLRSSIEDINSNFDDFIDNSNRIVDKIGSLFGVSAKQDLERIDELSLKKGEDISADDIDFIIEKSNTDVYIILKKKFRHLVDYYIKKIESLEDMFDYIDAVRPISYGREIFILDENNNRIYSEKYDDKIIGKYLSRYARFLYKDYMFDVSNKSNDSALTLTFLISTFLTLSFIVLFIESTNPTALFFALAFMLITIFFGYKAYEKIFFSIKIISEEIKSDIQIELKRVGLLQEFMRKEYSETGIIKSENLTSSNDSLTYTLEENKNVDDKRVMVSFPTSIGNDSCFDWNDIS
jgi:hypothetical protein